VELLSKSSSIVSRRRVSQPKRAAPRRNGPIRHSNAPARATPYRPRVRHAPVKHQNEKHWLDKTAWEHASDWWNATPVPSAMSNTLRTHRRHVSDVKDFTVSYTVGFLSATDNTKTGSAGTISFIPASNVQAANPGNGFSIYGMAPILPGDIDYGLAPVGQIIGSFERIRYKRIQLTIHPMRGSTSDDGVFIVAPLRGGYYTYTIGTSATSSTTYATLLDLQEAKSQPLWQQASIDLTPYIAGGSGSKENEFFTSFGTKSAASNAVTTVIPTAFVVAGVTNINASTSSYNYISSCRVTCSMDLLDWTAQAFGTNVALHSSKCTSTSTHKSVPWKELDDAYNSEVLSKIPKHPKESVSIVPPTSPVSSSSMSSSSSTLVQPIPILARQSALEQSGVVFDESYVRVAPRSRSQPQATPRSNPQ
jgi:hypothetical protein